MTNEQLCIQAKSGNQQALNQLVIQNQRFIHKVAYEVWNAQKELNCSLGIEIDDLAQEGTLGLIASTEKFQADMGHKFLTYAAPAIRNAMLDYIRKVNPTFEAKHLGNLVRPDELVKDENIHRYEFIADSRNQNPEQFVIAKEIHKEIHHALNQLSTREGMYLRYRFGFEDNKEHPLSQTAWHFHLSESRAKKTESDALDNVWLELPWWYG